MTDAPKTEKKKRASFTRTVRPIYMLVAEKQADGSLVPFDVSNLEIVFERDTDRVLELVSEGNYKPVKVELPAPAKRNTAPAA